MNGVLGLAALHLLMIGQCKWNDQDPAEPGIGQWNAFSANMAGFSYNICTRSRGLLAHIFSHSERLLPTLVGLRRYSVTMPWCVSRATGVLDEDGYLLAAERMDKMLLEEVMDQECPVKKDTFSNGCLLNP